MKKIYALLILSFFPLFAAAFEWQDLWQTPDQQASAVLKEDPAKAAVLFKNKEWQAVAEYRAHAYAKAAAAFAEENTAVGAYNQANALAKQGQLQAALDAYQKALKQHADFADAQFNYELVKKLLEEQQQSSSTNSEQASQPTPSSSDKTSAKEQAQNQPSQSSPAQNEQTQNSQAQSSASQASAPAQTTTNDSSTREQQSSQPATSEKAQKEATDDALNKQSSATEQNPPKDNQPATEETLKDQQAPKPQNASSETTQTEQQQALEQWLQRIPDDPGGLLRQKFLRDYQNYQQASAAQD